MHVAWLYIAVDKSCKLPTFINLKKKTVQENKLLMGQKRKKKCLPPNIVVYLVGCDILGGHYRRAAPLIRVLEWGPW